MAKHNFSFDEEKTLLIKERIRFKTGKYEDIIFDLKKLGYTNAMIQEYIFENYNSFLSQRTIVKRTKDIMEKINALKMP